jgi:hypothetical protein
MNEAYCKSLIKNIESNLKDFQSILNHLPDNIGDEFSGNSHELFNLFSTLTAVEEDVFEMRLKKIIDQENPYLPAIHPEEVRDSSPVKNSSLNQLIEKYLNQKESIVKYLYKVPFFYWDRTGVHELEGHVSFEEFIRRLIKNDNSNITALKKKIQIKNN